MIQLPLFECPNPECRHRWIPRPIKKGVPLAELPKKCPKCQRSFTGLAETNLLVSPQEKTGARPESWHYAALDAVLSSHNRDLKNLVEGALRIASSSLSVEPAKPAATPKPKRIAI